MKIRSLTLAFLSFCALAFLLPQGALAISKEREAKVKSEAYESISFIIGQKPQLFSIGVNNYRYSVVFGLLQQLLENHQLDHIKYIAIELPSDLQPLVDFITKVPNRETGRELAAGELDEYRNFLWAIRSENASRLERRMRPIRVIAMDLPQTKQLNLNIWFARRAGHMTQQLISASNNFSAPGIVVAGAGNLLKRNVQLVDLLPESLNFSPPILTLGSLLATLSELKSWTSLYVSNFVPSADKTIFVPKAFWPHLAVADVLRRDSLNAMLMTDQPAFYEIERQAPTVYPISRSFTHILAWPDTRSGFKKCLDAFQAFVAVYGTPRP